MVMLLNYHEDYSDSNSNRAARRPGKASRPHNGGARPNSYQRRANKRWMLDEWGDGSTCPCLHCGCELSFATVEADRIVAGNRGGGYPRDNIIPSCRRCNARRGDKSLWSFNPNLARRLVRRRKRLQAA